MALYDSIGLAYKDYRIPDKRIAKQIMDALGSAKKVLNVGAGAGSYEPQDREVVAVEPSEVMISQRPLGAAPVIQASAEDLPFPDKSFDASMAILTIHHWSDWRKGLKELLRVSNKVVILTSDPAHPGFWMTTDYFPEILATDKTIFPSLSDISSILGETRIETVPIPHGCTDGFGSAYWRRPEAYLQEEVRKAISTFSKIQNVEEGLRRLKEDLESGAWHKRHASLLQLEELDLGYRLLIATPDK